jgi:hypothetical protein
LQWFLLPATLVFFADSVYPLPAHEATSAHGRQRVPVATETNNTKAALCKDTRKKKKPSGPVEVDAAPETASPTNTNNTNSAPPKDSRKRKKSSGPVRVDATPETAPPKDLQVISILPRLILLRLLNLRKCKTRKNLQVELMLNLRLLLL